MQVLISAEGRHLDAAGAVIPHRMVVDNHGILLDLTPIGPPLLDPTILRVTWGNQLDGATIREGGTIFRQDGNRQTFWDRSVLQPYLDAYNARKVALGV